MDALSLKLSQERLYPQTLHPMTPRLLGIPAIEILGTMDQDAEIGDEQGSGLRCKENPLVGSDSRLGIEPDPNANQMDNEIQTGALRDRTGLASW